MRRIHLYISCLVVASCVIGGCSLKDAEDSVTICGESEKNCTTDVKFWASGRCVLGDCVVESCVVGAHLNDATCERDSVEACGEPPVNCLDVQKLCSEGQCVSNCKPHETECSGACIDITSDIANCGECGKPCGDNPEHGYYQCLQSQCVLKCNHGYVQSGNHCVIASDDPPAGNEPVCEEISVENGRCTCEPGADTCTVTCDEGFTYDGKGQCLCEEIEYGHGICECTDNNAVCVNHCDEGYKGEKCAECDEGYEANDNDACTPLVLLQECNKTDDCKSKLNADASCVENQCQWQCHDGFTLNAQKICADCEAHSDCTSKLTDQVSVSTCINYVCKTKECGTAQRPNEDRTECVANVIDGPEPVEMCMTAADCARMMPPLLGDEYWECGQGQCISHPCEPGTVPHPDRTECVPAQVEACVCEMKDGWMSYMCDATNQCIAAECDHAYYLENGDCHPFSVTHCGSSGKDCTKTAGWKDGKCTNGQCVATECDSAGYYLKSGKCQPYSQEYCGPKGINCTSTDGWLSGKCINSVCEVESCIPETHYLNSGDCYPYTTSHCGESGTKCTGIAGWKAGKCDKGKCVATECDTTNYYLQGGTCKPYTATRCGTSGTNCTTSIKGWKSGNCTNGACVATECDTTNYYLQGGTCKPYTATRCGTSGTNCTTSVKGWKSGNCTNGACVATECDTTNYYLEGGTCKPYTTTHCGTLNINCEELFIGWKSGKCESGECVVTECAPGYMKHATLNKCIPAGVVEECTLDLPYSCNNCCCPSQLACDKGKMSMCDCKLIPFPE